MRERECDIGFEREKGAMQILRKREISAGESM